MIKRLAGCIGEYKKSSILAPVFVTLETIMEVIIPLLMAYMIDRGITPGNMNQVLFFGVILLVCTIISLVFGILSGKHAAIASAGFAKNVRKKMYFRIQDFAFSNIDRFSTSGLVTRLTTDVTNLQNAYQMIVRIFVRCPAMLLLSLVLAFWINPRLSLIFLAAIPILGVGLYIIATRSHPYFKRVFKTYDKLNNVVQENLRGIRVVKSYVREDHEVDKFQNVSKSIFDDYTKAEKLLAFNTPLMQFAIYTCMLLISWFGANMIVSGSMTTGQLMSLFSYAAQILMSLMMLSMVVVMIVISRASAERISEVLAEETDIHNGDKPVMEVTDGSVSFQDVDFSYTGNTDKLVLKKINFDVKSGETVGIIGGTGSAKSTLVQLIPRLYDVTAGKVTVGGIDVREYDLNSIRDQVAMVLQKNVLFSGTIKENLRWGNKDATDEELIHACKLAQAHDFISAFPSGYDTFIEQGGSNVSGGQRQRLCIARALLKKPKILILDDSTSAVDTKTDSQLRMAFRQEIPETTKFIIAQRISSIEDADKIIVMDGGAINGIGSHEELLENNQIYQEVYYSQQKGGEENE